MLKTLQKKFVCINMCLVSLVLLVTFTAICMSNYKNMKDDWHNALMATAMMKEEPGPHQFPFDKKEAGTQPLPQPQKRSDNNNRLYNAVAFSVSIDADGKVISKLGNNVEISETLLNEMVQRVLTASETEREGYLREYQLRYLFLPASTEHTSRSIAFLDVSGQVQDFERLIITLVIVGIIGELAFLLISIFLARFTIKPVKTAWEQQRQFVADASHELKTPITVILANTGILLKHRDDTIASQEKWVDYTKEEAERMKKLVEDMLFLAKSDMAKLPLEKQEVNFSDLVLNSLLSFESVAFEQGISLEQDIAQDLMLCGNEAQLRQLITILLDNACKYATEDGRVKVTLSNKQEKLFLSVNNTGSYIPKEEQDRIFERFYRADESRVRKEGGYGLGLSIARSIAAAHKGKLTVASSEQDGTTFTVQL